MTKEIQIFNFDGSKVRTVLIDNNPYFVGKDVTKILGYKNFRDALTRYVPDQFKGVEKLDTLGGKQKLTVISEPGMYKLVFKSHAKNAEKFTDWVASDVLPSIRKTGSYQISDNSLPISPLEKLKLVMESTVQIGDELKKTQKDVDYLKNHRFIVSGQANYLGSAIGKSVYGWYNANKSRVKWRKNDAIKLLYKDLNHEVKAVSGARTRTTIEVGKYDMVCQLIDNWKPSSSTITRLVNPNFDEEGDK